MTGFCRQVQMNANTLYMHTQIHSQPTTSLGSTLHLCCSLRWHTRRKCPLAAAQIKGCLDLFWGGIVRSTLSYVCVCGKETLRRSFRQYSQLSTYIKRKSEVVSITEKFHLRLHCEKVWFFISSLWRGLSLILPWRRPECLTEPAKKLVLENPTFSHNYVSREALLYASLCLCHMKEGGGMERLASHLIPLVGVQLVLAD